jgi:formylglycine-generating enzyme required for sulfatase activity
LNPIDPIDLECYGRWEAPNLDTAAIDLTWDEAQAWCARAGRRLPTEAE